MNIIYLAVVVPGDEKTYPKVPPVLGPFHPSETRAIERGEKWLRMVHGEDVRQVEPAPDRHFPQGVDPDGIRAQVYNAVVREWTDARTVAQG